MENRRSAFESFLEYCGAEEYIKASPAVADFFGVTPVSLGQPPPRQHHTYLGPACAFAPVLSVAHEHVLTQLLPVLCVNQVEPPPEKCAASVSSLQLNRRHQNDVKTAQHLSSERPYLSCLIAPPRRPAEAAPPAPVRAQSEQRLSRTLPSSYRLCSMAVDCFLEHVRSSSLWKPAGPPKPKPAPPVAPPVVEKPTWKSHPFEDALSGEIPRSPHSPPL